MKASELRAKDDAGLQKEISDLLQAHFKLRMQKATQQLADHSQLKKTRREVARAKTIQATNSASTMAEPRQSIRHALRIAHSSGLDGATVATTAATAWVIAGNVIVCVTPRRTTRRSRVGTATTICPPLPDRQKAEWGAPGSGANCFAFGSRLSQRWAPYTPLSGAGAGVRL